ncbi:sulfite exporter TauE/SafE family protein [Eionea flava]
MDWVSLTVAFSIGLLGATHCIGMCGGIMGALTMGISDANYSRRLYFIVLYNFGRITSYVLIAYVFYQFVDQIQGYFSLQFMRIIAGCLLIAMGLYLASWWRGLMYLEKAGGYVWRYIQPLSRSLLPVNSPVKALFLGALWGWLPCGLIYSALAYAISANSTFQAVATMLAFSLGTLPAVVASGLFAERLVRWVRNSRVRQGLSVLIILFGVWTLVTAQQHQHVSESHVHHHMH